MAGCSSSVKLLCDSGASVNATDFVRINFALHFTHCVLMVSSNNNNNNFYIAPCQLCSGHCGNSSLHVKSVRATLNLNLVHLSEPSVNCWLHWVLWGKWHIDPLNGAVHCVLCCTSGTLWKCVYLYVCLCVFFSRMAGHLWCWQPRCVIHASVTCCWSEGLTSPYGTSKTSKRRSNGRIIHFLKGKI